jgi:RecB family exonuclease
VLGDLRLPAIRALARHADVLSAGALEDYAGCPVRWLVERELRPERFEPDPDALRRGSFIHAVLERTLTELREATGSARLTPASVEQARAILDRVVAEERDALEEDLPPVTARSAVRAIAADLRRYLEHAAATGETPYEPARFEQRFGLDDDPDALPALRVGQGEDAVRVRGAIDRVDVGPCGRAIVRDYKSGKVRDGMAVAGWEKHATLQIGLYMLAVRDLLGLIPVGGVYQPLRGGKPTDLRARGVMTGLPETEALVGPAVVDRDVLAAEDVDAALDAVSARVVELARDLRAGRLAPQPETCGWSGGCAYPGICRSGG